MDNKKLAKELVDLAKEIVSSEKTAEYITLMQYDENYIKGVKLIMKAFKDWKNGELTEHNMIPGMRKQMLEDIEKKLR